MKKIISTIAISFLLLTASLTAFAQSEEDAASSYSVPRWLSEMGYWVVETNLYTPNKNIVYFYNNDNKLVYKENVDGIVIKLKKRRVKMYLKKALEQSVKIYNKKMIADENQMLVTNRMRKH